MSLDGRTATPPGTSPWISGEPSRELVHVWRGECDAIAVGIGTALEDDPLLTARRGGAPVVGPGAVAEPGVGDPAGDGKAPLRQPTRIVFDSRARLPLDSRLLATTDQAPVLVVAGPEAETERLAALQSKGAETILAGGATPRERVLAALPELGRRGLTSLMLEGGATLINAFAAAEQIDEARVFVAPLILGGPAPDLPPVVFPGGIRLEGAAEAPELVGRDTLITTRFKEW